MTAFENVISIVEEETGQKVTRETKLEDVVKDSLDFLDLILRVSRDVGEIPDAVASKVDTVDDLYRAAVGELR